MEDSGVPTGVVQSKKLADGSSGCGFHVGVTLNICGLILTALVLLQLEMLPLSVMRLGWWPVLAGTVFLAGAWCVRCADVSGHQASQLFRVRLSALLLFGLSPFWNLLPLSVRVNPARIGIHGALCILGCVVAFVWHNLAFAAMQQSFCKGDSMRHCLRDAALWRKMMVLPLGTLAGCMLLVMAVAGDLKWRVVPDALVHSITSVGPVPVAVGWLVCLVCVLSASLRCRALNGAIVACTEKNVNPANEADKTEMTR